MPGLWKAWKAKGRLPTLSTSPLEISPTAGEIPTFPQRRRRGRWKSGKPKTGFPRSHRPDSSLSKPKQKPKPNGGLRPQRPKRLKEKPMKGDIVAAGYSSHTEVATSGSLRIGMNRLFQAHLALESNLDFRLISGLENAAPRPWRSLQRAA